MVQAALDQRLKEICFTDFFDGDTTGGIPERHFDIADYNAVYDHLELGGKIVIIGFDSHSPGGVGKYARESCDVLKEIFRYVCTFEDRNPIFKNYRLPSPLSERTAVIYCTKKNHRRWL